jgi:hypothetical protein
MGLAPGEWSVWSILAAKNGSGPEGQKIGRESKPAVQTGAESAVISDELERIINFMSQRCHQTTNCRHFFSLD